MPRQLRQFEISGIYHILNRGVEKRKIFIKTQDYSRFILALEFFNRVDETNLGNFFTKVGSDPTFVRLEKERAKNREPIIEILAFVLMPNHYHLIIREIRKGGISLFMNKLGGYASYFNKQHNRVGPLFQSRYKAVPIKTDSQLGTIFPYVHTNPVELKERQWKDGKVKNMSNAIKWLDGYKWSSYRDYVGNPTFPKTTHRTFFLELYGGEKKCRKEIEDWIKFKAKNIQLDTKLLE